MENMAELRRRYDYYAEKAEQLCEVAPTSEACRNAQAKARAAYRQYLAKVDSVDLEVWSDVKPSPARAERIRLLRGD